MHFTLFFQSQEIIQDRDEERDRLRKELQRTRAMLSSEAAVRTSSLSVTSPPSRPASFISVEESSASERNQESEDDGGKLCVSIESGVP